MGTERDDAGSAEVSPETLGGRLRTRERNPQWKKAPRYIEPAECIGCDSCIRACPPEFDAIHNHGPDVVIVSELCSGCGKCVWACPMDCIYVDERWETTSNSVWINVLAKAAGNDGE